MRVINKKQLVVDISEHNGAIDFQKLKASGAGCMLRLSLGYKDGGVYRLDKQADRNIRGCAAYGIPWGVYHYSYADTEQGAREEAAGVIEILSRYKAEGLLPSLPIAYDMEDNHDLPNGDHGGASFEELRRFCTLFCEAVEAAGYYAAVYASLSWFRQMGNLDRFDHWLAHWDTEKPGKECGMWQFTSKGDGASYGASSQHIDLNWAFMDYPKTIQSCGLNGHSKRKYYKAKGATPDTDPKARTTLVVGEMQHSFDEKGNLIRSTKKGGGGCHYQQKT